MEVSYNIFIACFKCFKNRSVFGGMCLYLCTAVGSVRAFLYA